MHRDGVRTLLATVLVSALTTFGAYAQDSVSTPPPLLLLPAACNTDEGAVPYVIDDSMLALLRLELSPSQVLVVGEGEQSATAEGKVVIRLSVCGDHAKLARITCSVSQDAQEVDLSGLSGGARARTLALVLSGLGSAPEAFAPPTAEAELTVDRPSGFVLDPELKPRPPAPVVRAPSTELGGAAEARTYPAPNTTLYGLRMTARFPRYVAGAVALVSRDAQEAGVVSLGVAAATVGYTLVRRTRHPHLGLDLFGELGATWAHGSALSLAARERRRALHASAGLGPWLHIRLSSHWIATASLLVGYSRGLQATIASTRVATSHGPFVGLSLGVAFRGES